MRDGNLIKKVKKGIPKKVVSLPMRDGNPDRNVSCCGTFKLLAYL